jgi:hypothetical protein
MSTEPEAMVATLCRSSMPATEVASSLTLLATSEAARLMPALRAMGLTPEVTACVVAAERNGSERSGSERSEH